MKSLGTFPFGQPVQDVVQTDRTPKKIFVLGVYASAVHARWISPQGKTVVNALAVASEPVIFWRGEEPETIIQKIGIPKELGMLIPAHPGLNGPSGKALDRSILSPLGLAREEAWLCDLVPHSCVNPAQGRAIEREYLPVASKYGLPEPSVPRLPILLTDNTRRKEILDEIIESEARIIILLGDLPIKWFLYHYSDHRWSKLSDFGQDPSSYGQLHDIHVDGKEMKVLPLAHPRQIDRLGQSSVKWSDAHKDWIKESANRVGQFMKSG